MATENKILEISIYQKLTAIQTELKAPKGQYNSYGKYKYRSCEDILEALKPYLKAHGFTLILTDDLVCMLDRIYVKATAILSNGKDEIRVNGFAREELIKKGMDGSQITGTSSSYARKYALNGMFLIDDNKDSDHTNEGDDKKSAPAPAPMVPKVLTEDQFNTAKGSGLQGMINTLKVIAKGKITATEDQIAELTDAVFDYQEREKERLNAQLATQN